MALRIDQRCKRCRGPVALARSGATGLWFAVDAAAVPPGTRGAMVVIGEQAFSRAGAVKYLAAAWVLDDATADQVLADEYTWHLPHKVTCIKGRPQ